MIAIDRDPAAIRAGESLASCGGRLELVEARFGDLAEVARRLGTETVDGVVFDVGVSSMQLDEPERGFSFRFDAPLDMRMGGEGRSAADILREEDDETIADILFTFGEERAARKIARAIVADRKTKPFCSTLELASLIARVAPAPRGELTIQRPARSKLCASPSMTNWANSCAGFQRPSGSSSPAGVSRR